MTRVLLVAWLTVLWLVLWRDVSVANVVSGVAIALVVLAVFPPRQVTGDHALRPLKLVAFISYFAWKLVVSNLIVAREIVTPRDHVRSGIVAVPVVACSDLVTTVVANAISLTPGTLTLEVRRDPMARTVAQTELANESISRLFEGVVEATEEAIYNSMLKAVTTTYGARTVEALPIDRVVEVLQKYGVR